MTAGGLEVLDLRPDFSSEFRTAAGRLNSRTEFGQARRYAGFPGKDAIHVLGFTYVLRGTQIAQLQAFHEARAGRWGAFLVPSWQSDLSNGATNSITTPVGVNNVVIDWCDYANNFKPALGDPGRLGRFVFVLSPAGILSVSEVVGVSATAVGDYDWLDTNQELHAQLVPGDGSIVGFAHKVRFGDDDLVLNYSGPGNATAELNFTQVLTSTPETDIA